MVDEVLVEVEVKLISNSNLMTVFSKFKLLSRANSGSRYIYNTIFTYLNIKLYCNIAANYMVIKVESN